MSTLLPPFKSLARWCHKLLGLRSPWAAEAGASGRQEHGARDAGVGEPHALAGKWPDQTDLMTRLTTTGGAIRLNGSRTARDVESHETRVHHEPRLHVYKFPGMR